MTVFCPKCAKKVPGFTGRYGIRYQCCGLVGWNGKPLVTPETLLARRQAHDVFDRLWKHGHMSRSHAYVWLCGAMGYDAHMSTMSEKQARRVVMLSFKELRRLGDQWAKKRKLTDLYASKKVDPDVQLTEL